MRLARRWRMTGNWRSARRIATVLVNPLEFVMSAILRKTPASVRVRTPIGIISLRLRNHESVRTLFSIFCREDYPIESNVDYCFIDVGSNIGISAVYFLTRNPKNTAFCFEPDPSNEETLRENLAQFAGRARLSMCAVGSDARKAILYCAEDGKYSSLQRSRRAKNPTVVDCVAFGEVLKSARAMGQRVVVKIDVEGLESVLVNSVKFEEFPHVVRLFSESTTCSDLISRRHTRSVRNGYVEDIAFAE